MIEAKIICDSISPQSIRLATFKLRYPKFIHGEFMTHRVFSRNASSSRAVPVSKNIEEVRNDLLRAEPVFWGAEQKGMQPGAELDDTIASMRWADRYDIDVELMVLGDLITPKEYARRVWKYAALDAADRAELLHKAGAHKSLVNRILEPYLHINVICSATEYMNFFGLRLDTDADPTMRALAEAMWREYNESQPKRLLPDEWHQPFVTDEDREHLYKADTFHNEILPIFGRVDRISVDGVLNEISAARCARISYTSFETGKRSTIEEDIKLCQRLRNIAANKPGHWSPFEHQATPDRPAHDDGIRQVWDHKHKWGNFIGWRQNRKMQPHEQIAPLPEKYWRNPVAWKYRRL